MDEIRFDALARRLAGSLGRRTLLRGVIGGVAVLVRRDPVAARAGTAPLGAICLTSDDCQDDGMGSAPLCGDNGIGKDGSLNCCREDGCCASDADCCGDRQCAPTGDVCSVCAFPPFATRFLGQPCDSTADCVASVVGKVICADNGIPKDGPLTCCFEEGGFCSASNHALCCGELRCIADKCQNPDSVDPDLDADAAGQSAIRLSTLEADGKFDLLYDLMHPDAQAMIPRAVVVGWYRDNFAPRGPGQITVDAVQFVDWTWDVTGVTYEDTAEITYRQPFADGSTVTDVTRLVQDHAGQWRWFFGRTQEFVDAQIAKYGGGS